MMIRSLLGLAHRQELEMANQNQTMSTSFHCGFIILTNKIQDAFRLLLSLCVVEFSGSTMDQGHDHDNMKPCFVYVLCVHMR